MKTINSLTLTSMPVSSSYTGVDRSADEDARVRREAERAQLRRLQGDARRHADADLRLADAMARASARTVQQARPSRVAPESAALMSMANGDDIAAEVAAIAPLAKSMDTTEDETRVERLASDAREALEAFPDPAGSLLERLSLGQSRGLLQDCTPMLESIAAQWTNRALQPPASGSRDRDELESALDFLQGYADASAGRLSGAERLVKLVMQVRQQLLASGADPVSSTAVLAAASQQVAAQSPGIKQALRSGKDREHVNAVRKVRRERDSDEELSDGDGKLETAGAAAVAARAGADAGKVATVSESSLDKDQRKRRDDTLPLVTLRSI